MCGHCRRNPSEVSHCRYNSESLNLQRIEAASTAFEAVAYQVNYVLYVLELMRVSWMQAMHLDIFKGNFVGGCKPYSCALRHF